MEQGLIVAEFEYYLKTGGRKLKDSSINQYVSCIKSFFNNGYNVRNKDDYIKYLRKHTIEKRSSHHYDITIKFVNWYFKEKSDLELRKDILEAIKLLGKRNFDPIKETEILNSFEQMQVINNLLNYKHRLVAWIQKETGVRAGDVLRLKKHKDSNDTDIRYGLYQGKEVIMNITFTLKRDKIRIIPIFNQELINEIEEYLVTTNIDEEYLFCSRNNVHPDNINNSFKVESRNYYLYWKDLRETCIKLGLDPHKFTSHDIRRNFAYDIWVNDLESKDIVSLQKILGHSNIETTIRYLRTSGLEVQDLYKKKQNR